MSCTEVLRAGGVGRVKFKKRGGGFSTPGGGKMGAVVALMTGAFFIFCPSCG